MSEKRGQLLIEIGTEELPTAAVTVLPQAGQALWQKALTEANLSFEKIESFGSPRRLAWRISGLATKQAEQKIERKGPALQAAKDKNGNWTKAAMGFAASCGVLPDALTIVDTPKGQWLMYYSTEAGKTLSELLPSLFASVVDHLPIAKRMRWGDYDHAFVRPVLTLVALFDDEVLPLEFFGITAGRESLGHRVHHPQPVIISHAREYENDLKQGFVIASHDQRMKVIQTQVEAKAAELGGKAIMPSELWAEVASLTEWPVAVAGSFEKRFLDVPQEVLITTMEDNQKTFAVVDQETHKMLPNFIAVANLQSTNEDEVRKGNEKVIRPRFADAEFFWQQDLKRPLSSHLAGLGKVIYQEKLGSLAEKSERVAKLGEALSELTGANVENVVCAAALAKCDLLSEMVMEFPELQGFMGRCYAEKEGLAEDISAALEEQYFPKGAGGDLPQTKTGLTLAIAEKLDTITGGFAIGAKPTGSKDPYALRRMAISLIRLVLENQLTFPLQKWVSLSAEILDFSRSGHLNADAQVAEVCEYIIERLEHYYREQNVAPEIYQAVRAVQRDDLLDFNYRVHALSTFITQNHASSLLASAKRIRNILRKNGERTEAVNPDLLTENAEKALWQASQTTLNHLDKELSTGDYLAALTALSQLSQPLEDFFDGVMVMAEDQALQNNRLALLTTLQNAFTSIADLSLL